MLKHEDDARTMLNKIVDATNEVVRLTSELIALGDNLNIAKGKYAECKARIKAQKEIISSAKVIVKAEQLTSGGF